MKLNFWKKDKPKDDETSTVVTVGPGSKQIAVTAKTSVKALEIYNKLKDEK